MQSNIHKNLIKSSVQEGGVDGYNWVKPAKSHASRRSYGVLFRDTNIKYPIWEAVSKLIKTHRYQHCTGDTNQSRVDLGYRGHLISEDRCPASSV